MTARGLGLAIGLIFSTGVWAQNTYTVGAIPNPKSDGTGYVSNPDGVLSDNAVYRLNVLCDSMENTHGVQCAVVIVRSIGTAVPKTFATDLFNHWGVGGKEKDSGLLLLVVMDQRRSEFETGYGVEEFLPDVVCVRLLENHLNPKFKAGLYDDGVINVMQAVNKELTDHEVRDYFKAIGVSGSQTSRPSEGRPWGLFSALMLFYVVVAYIIWTVTEQTREQWLAQNDATLADKKKKKYTKILRIAPIPRFWLFVALAPFPAMMCLIFFADDKIDTPTLWGGFVIFGYVSLLFGLLVNRVYRTRAIRKYYAGDPYNVHQKLSEDHDGWWMALIVFLPVFIFYFLPYWASKSGLRRAPRNGLKTGLPMRRLTEAEEDKYLTAGQQKEETLRSVDYDVWITPNAEEVVVLRYPSWWSSYSDCPACRHKTRSKKTTTIVQPTYTSTGTGQTVHTCHYCGHRETSTFVIPKKERSESSGGSSGSGGGWSSGGGSSGSGGGWSSGGGSSSWGGGSSGGGGGGSSW